VTGAPVHATRASYADLAREILARPARLGRVRLVAVDGGTGAGKSHLADRLVVALRAAGALTSLVPTDDLLDGWADQFAFWPRLEAKVLDPVASGRPGRYRRYDWDAGAFAGAQVEVPVPDVLVLEGVSVARLEVRQRLTLAVFVTAEPGSRLARVVARDGVAIEPQVRAWMAAEVAHFARNATPERVDVLVDGDPRVQHDPEVEYVRLR
jgi:uridine kinase